MPMLRTEQATIESGFGSHFQMACPMRSIVSWPKRSTVWRCITTSAKACLRTMKRRQNGFDSLLIKVSIALSLNLARLTRMVEAYHRVTSMRKNGFASRLGRVSISRRLRWGLYIPQGGVYRKTMMRPQNGIVVRLTKASQERNLLSERCTRWPRRTPELSGSSEMLSQCRDQGFSTILEACTT